jgi:uncharacterized protein (DUF169 family)
MLERKDFTVLDRFNFEAPPVALKLLARPPDRVKKLEGKAAFCEMLKKAQGGAAFWAAADNHSCEAGLYVLGQVEAPGPYISGEFGAGLKIFEEPRSAARLYHHLPRTAKGVANYVFFSPVDKLSFDPDLLIILAGTGQTEIILRAMSYKTGKPWTSRFAPAIGCAWIFIYPYLSGEVNYVLTGLGHGMKRRNLFPEGRQLISIPFDQLGSMLQVLKEMPWDLPALQPDGPEFVRKLSHDLGLA